VVKLSWAGEGDTPTSGILLGCIGVRLSHQGSEHGQIFSVYEPILVKVDSSSEVIRKSEWVCEEGRKNF
jgi:hypothetical protein